MDELIKAGSDLNIVTSIVLVEAISALFLSAFLNTILSFFYSHTHEGYSYSKSFAQTIVLVGVIIALIMIIIGSNIARAFALVGAMSIVRFRNPVKDPRDLVFIFAAIAIGMACGTDFFLLAVVFLIIFCLILLTFRLTNFGQMNIEVNAFKIQLPLDKRPDLIEILEANTSNYSIVSYEGVLDNEELENLVIEIEIKRNIDKTEFVNEINTKTSPNFINFLVGDEGIGA